MSTSDAWRWVGESALLRRFDGDLIQANSRALAVAGEVRARASDDVEDVVVGARTLLVQLRQGAQPPRTILDALEGEPSPVGPSRREMIEIAVAYGGGDGPDLAEVARHHGIDEREVVRLHGEPDYVVGFIGFSPGFPYLIGLPEALATPRLETPRIRIPAGSVAIGGPYAGVYPRATPGGWRLIGRTDLELFDPTRDPPNLLAPGDRVRFVPA